VAPVECWTWIGLASWRNVAVSGDPGGRQAGVGLTERSNAPGERQVLSRLIRQGVGALEFNAYRKIIAGGPAFKAGLACVPGPIVEFYILRQAPVAGDHQMRGDAQGADFGEVRVHIHRQPVREQPIDPLAAEFPRRQANPVHDDKVRRNVRGSGIEVR
jgi:hypothetical protein